MNRGAFLHRRTTSILNSTPSCRYPEIHLTSIQLTSTLEELRPDYIHASLLHPDTRNLCSGLHHCEVGPSYSPLRTCDLCLGSRSRYSNRQGIRAALGHTLHLHYTAPLPRIERNRSTPPCCSARYICAGGVAPEGLLLKKRIFERPYLEG